MERRAPAEQRGDPFTTAAPGSNVYIRPYANTHWIVLQFQASNVGPGNYHILGHAGFGGGPGVPNTAKMQTRHYLAKMAPTTANTGWLARTPVNAQALPNPVAQERLDLFQDHIATNALPGGTKYQDPLRGDGLFPRPADNELRISNCPVWRAFNAAVM